MHKLVSLNLQIESAENSSIPAVSPAALYGKAVFTTLSVEHSKPFLWEKHWHRLQSNCQKLNVDLSGFTEAGVKTALFQIIEENHLERGRARLTFFDRSANGIWQFESSNRTDFLITTADFRETKTKYRLTVSPFSINSNSPLANVKSCNYLENLLAFEEAGKRGYDEAVRLNEKGEIVSATMANIFWIKNETIFTPALETGCLAGTTREFLLENCAVWQIKAELPEITGADEIFLTSAGIGLRSAFFENVSNQSADSGQKLGRIRDLLKA